MWAVCGGFFITNFILCNWLPVLIEPVFENPVDNAQDVYDRDITIYMRPGNNIWMQQLSKLPNPFPELAERMYITSSYDEFDNISKYQMLKKESFLLDM